MRLFPLRRSHAHELPECFGESLGRIEPCFAGDFTDGAIGLHQHALAGLKAQCQHVLLGADAHRPAEQKPEMCRGETHIGGDIADQKLLVEMAVNPLQGAINSHLLLNGEVWTALAQPTPQENHCQLINQGVALDIRMRKPAGDLPLQLIAMVYEAAFLQVAQVV